MFFCGKLGDMQPERDEVVQDITQFRKELGRWSEELLNSKVQSPRDVSKKAIQVELKLNLDDDDAGLFALFSDMMGVVGTQETNKGLVDKTQSVELQQDFVREVLRRSKNGVFENEKFTRFFEAVLVIYEKLRDDRLFVEKDVQNMEGFVIGIRGIISAALLFSKSGFEVSLPKVDWDLHHDIDLLVKKGEKTYSVSVKSSIKNVDEITGKNFSVKRLPKDVLAPKEYRDTVEGHIWINIPNQLSLEARSYCEPNTRNVATGVPSMETVSGFSKILRELKVE